MCWCLRVYWTVLHNLLARFFSNVFNCVYNSSNLCSCIPCGSSSVSCCVCCDYCLNNKEAPPHAPDETNVNNDDESAFMIGGERTVPAKIVQHHDYVIVDDVDANYLEIERRKIETEQYYRLVDRATAEDILNCREDGSCLVRPFKEADLSIKYIVTVFAQQQYFHLFIRQIKGQNLYGIGQRKPDEKTFSSPSEIIDFYRFNPLQCINKKISISLLLKPIVS